MTAVQKDAEEDLTFRKGYFFWIIEQKLPNYTKKRCKVTQKWTFLLTIVSFLCKIQTHTSLLSHIVSAKIRNPSCGLKIIFTIPLNFPDKFLKTKDQRFIVKCAKYCNYMAHIKLVSCQTQVQTCI